MLICLNRFILIIHWMYFKSKTHVSYTLCMFVCVHCIFLLLHITEYFYSVYSYLQIQLSFKKHFDGTCRLEINQLTVVVVTYAHVTKHQAMAKKEIHRPRRRHTVQNKVPHASRQPVEKVAVLCRHRVHQSQWQPPGWMPKINMERRKKLFMILWFELIWYVLCACSGTLFAISFHTKINTKRNVQEKRLKKKFLPLDCETQGWILGGQ